MQSERHKRERAYSKTDMNKETHQEWGGGDSREREMAIERKRLRRQHANQR